VKHYAGWTEKRSAGFLDDLIDVIVKRDVVTVGAAVNVSAFRALPADSRRELTGGFTLTEIGDRGEVRAPRFLTSGVPNRPYAVSFVAFIDTLLQATSSDLRTHFVFDRQTVFEPHAVEQFRQLVKSRAREYPDRLGGITYAGKEQSIPLQAADLNAYLWNSWLEQGKSMAPDRSRALARLRLKPTWMKVLEKEHLEEWVAENAKRRNAWYEYATHTIAGAPHPNPYGFPDTRKSQRQA
jgi:hypothetical protein